MFHQEDEARFNIIHKETLLEHQDKITKVYPKGLPRLYECLCSSATIMVSVRLLEPTISIRSAYHVHIIRIPAKNDNPSDESLYHADTIGLSSCLGCCIVEK